MLWLIFFVVAAVAVLVVWWVVRGVSILARAFE